MRIAHGVLREDWNNIRTETSTLVQLTEESIEQRRNDTQDSTEMSNQPEMKSCNLCGTTCNSRQEMTIHKKTQHFSHKPCQNFSLSDQTKRCTYRQDCAFSHIPVPMGKHRCFECGQEFNSKGSMMIHRKANHDKLIICKKFMLGQCTRTNECWFSHTTPENTFRTTTQGFQPRVEVWEPPARREERVKMILNQMIPQILTQIMSNMNLD